LLTDLIIPALGDSTPAGPLEDAAVLPVGNLKWC
jgi:hypothetical protein